MYLVAALKNRATLKKKKKNYNAILKLTVVELDEAKQCFGFGQTKLYNAQPANFFEKF